MLEYDVKVVERTTILHFIDDLLEVKYFVVNLSPMTLKALIYQFRKERGLCQESPEDTVPLIPLKKMINY